MKQDNCKDENSIEKIVEMQRKLVPEMMDIFLRRYEILNLININNPIGRRNLSSYLDLGEKIVRNEVAILQKMGLIDIKTQGMYITQAGLLILDNAKKFVYKFKGLNLLEEQIRKKFGIKKVIVVSNDIDELNIYIKKETGRMAAEYLKSIVHKDAVIGITGGSTMAAFVNELPQLNFKEDNLTVIPARGGIGINVETQSNMVAAVMAAKWNVSYKLLHMPENISKEVRETLYLDPATKEVLDLLENMDIFIFGVGRADEMAKRRLMNQSEIDELISKNAVAEAFGYYFDNTGKIVKNVNTVGVRLEAYKEMKHVICIVTGKEKKEAFQAIGNLNKNLVLVMDEELALSLLDKHDINNNNG